MFIVSIHLLQKHRSFPLLRGIACPFTISAVVLQSGAYYWWWLPVPSGWDLTATRACQDAEMRGRHGPNGFRFFQVLWTLWNIQAYRISLCICTDELNILSYNIDSRYFFFTRPPAPYPHPHRNHPHHPQLPYHPHHHHHHHHHHRHHHHHHHHHHRILPRHNHSDNEHLARGVL